VYGSVSTAHCSIFFYTPELPLGLFGLSPPRQQWWPRQQSAPKQLKSHNFFIQKRNRTSGRAACARRLGSFAGLQPTSIHSVQLPAAPPPPIGWSRNRLIATDSIVLCERGMRGKKPAGGGIAAGSRTE